MCIKETAKETLGISKSILNMIKEGLKTKNVKGSAFIAFLFGFIVDVVFYCFNFEMSSDAWFYVFSALSQTLAAFIAFGAMVLLYRFGSDAKGKEDARVELINELNGPYSIILTSIVLSIMLLTFSVTNFQSNKQSSKLYYQLLADI